VSDCRPGLMPAGRAAHVLKHKQRPIGAEINLNAEALVKLQEQAASGNYVNRASDSPSDAYRILALNSQERSLANYEEQITNLIGDLEITSTIIEDMAEALAATTKSRSPT